MGTKQNSTRRLAAREEKRRRFEESGSGRARLLNFALLAVAVALFAMGGLMLLGVGQSGTPVAPNSVAASGANAAGEATRRASGEFTTVEPKDGLIALPVADFADGKAKFYTLDTGVKEIDFFVLRSSDGVIRAAFDSCDVCYAARKGYQQQGDEMVCNNCGQRFPSDKINEVKGGCNPAPLTREVQDDTLIIRASDVIGEGDRYF